MGRRSRPTGAAFEGRRWVDVQSQVAKRIAPPHEPQGTWTRLHTWSATGRAPPVLMETRQTGVGVSTNGALGAGRRSMAVDAFPERRDTRSWGERG